MANNDGMWKKFRILIVAIALITLSIFPATMASASYGMDNDDGTWMDTFDNDTLINAKKSNKIMVEQSSIRVESGIFSSNYDFTKTNFSSGSSAFKRKNVLTIPPSYLSDGRLLGGFFETVWPILKDHEFNEEEYTQISCEDDKRIETEAVIGRHAVHHFVFKVTEPRKNIESFSITWAGHASDGYAKLYIWNYTEDAALDNKHWDKIGETPVNAADDRVTPSISKDKINDYVNTEGYIHVVVESEKSRSKLFGNTTKSLYTNYIGITVTARKYEKKGYLVSTEIAPQEENISRWGHLVWNDRELQGTDVKYRVYKPKEKGLVGELELVSELKGNEEGFDDPPVDLSAIDPSTKLYLNATLTTSENAVFSPRIYDWGVTWQQSKYEWSDSFSTSYRTTNLEQTMAQNNSVLISEIENDWPMFGRTVTNQRVTSGFEVESNSLLWRTGTGVAGQFCSPIVDNGVVYVASQENRRITARNATNGGIGGEVYWRSERIDENIMGTPTATEHLVIIGSCEEGTVNKVYAFDKPDGEMAWDPFQYDTSTELCFYGQPVVHDGKVFVAGSKNVALEVPQVGIEGVYKLFALREEDGKMLWSVDLPAASYGSPAIHEGVVYVGCANSNGSSLFAISENSGSILQESNLGAVGRASPVIYKDKLFVTSVKNESMSVPATGSAKIVVVNTSDITNIVWERNLGQINTLQWANLVNSLLGSHFNLIPDNAVACSTPVIHNNTVFVGSPDGVLYAFDDATGQGWWSFDTSGKYLFSSPAVAGNTVYVASYDGTVHAIRETDGKEIWNYQPPREVTITSSPIIVEGILYISDDEGRVYAIGSHSQKFNKQGRIVSSLITPSKNGMWFNKFYGTAELNGGTITYSILDQNYEPLMGDLHSGDDISSLKSNEIHLCADLSRDDQSKNPRLLSWGVTMREEPDDPCGWTLLSPENWTNVEHPTVSSYVEDNTSGLDAATAQYAINYSIIPKNYSSIAYSTVAGKIGQLYLTNPDVFAKIVSYQVPFLMAGQLGSVTYYHVYTPWREALCDCTQDLKSGMIYAENVSITEETLRDTLPWRTFREYFGEYGKNYTIDVNGIVFNVSDLAGNWNNSDTYEIKVDSTDPSSSLVSIAGWYKETPVLSATATDKKSGVDYVTLYYQFSSENVNWSNWIQYNSAFEQPWEWSFSPEKGDGYYKVYTAAVDNAKNEENRSEGKIVQLGIDTHQPNPPRYPADRWYNATAPTLTIGVSDNLLLKTAEYKIGRSNTYMTFAQNISEAETNLTLEISVDEWEKITAGNETYIYFRITDYAGNTYETTVDKDAFNIVKDVVSPESVVNKIRTAWQYDTPFKVSLEGFYDDASPIRNITLYYRFSRDNKTWTNWTAFETDVEEPWEWSFTAPKGSGYYEFYSQATDNAENKEPQPVSSTVAEAATGVNVIPLVLTMVLVVLGVIAIIVPIVMKFILPSKSERTSKE